VDPLAQRLKLRSGAELENRFAKAAMSEQLADAAHGPSAALPRAYEAWARGGAGLLVTGNVMVSGSALGEPGNVVVEDQRHLDALRAWTAAVRAASPKTALWMQLNHPGRQAPRNLTREPIAPSAVPLEGLRAFFATPRALEEVEVWALVEAFARSATVAEKAGFGGVQIHGAHGYLISQFLSPLTNRRHDAFGGTPEKRRRFLLEIVRAVRGAVSSGFALSVKLNSADFQRGGFSEEESMEVVAALDQEAIDLLEISGGTYERAAMWGDAGPRRDSTRSREGYFLAYAEKVRSLVRLPLMVTGGFRTAAGMRGALSSGAVDVVGLARPLAAEPDLPRRILSGEADGALRIDLSIGQRRVDTLLEAYWYQRQIGELGRGRPARPRAGRLFALGALAPSLGVKATRIR
jgi:2,4-dienoyl-CoA reductase-like NADH-dependent reductase (Old Yellow Enzyme family)